MDQALDKKIQEYLSLLRTEEKKSLVAIMKTFLTLRKDTAGRISKEVYNKELDAALARVKNGAYETQEDVEKEAAKW